MMSAEGEFAKGNNRDHDIDGHLDHRLAPYPLRRCRADGRSPATAAGPDPRRAWVDRFASGALAWLGLGASDDFVVDSTGRRSYNLATGVIGAADASVRLKGFEYISMIWRHYSLFNLNVIGSRPGRETWDIVQSQLEIPVGSKFGVGFEAEYCSRRFDFEDSTAGGRNLIEARVFVAWQF